MTYLEKIKLALADAKGRFVGFELVSKSLDSKMNKKGNPFYGAGFTYVSRLTVRAGVEYANLATSPEVVGSSPSWATREVDLNGVVSYRKNSDCRKLYLGVAPTAGSKKIFSPDGKEVTTDQNFEFADWDIQKVGSTWSFDDDGKKLFRLESYLKKSSGQPTWLTIAIDSIASATINGETHRDDLLYGETRIGETAVSPCYVL